MDMIKNLTPLQWLGIVVLLNGVIIGGTSQLTDLFGAGVTHKLVAVAGLGNMFFGGLVTMFSGQGTQVKNVLAMPGVEKISVNGQANTTLAQIAVDPAQAKIEPTSAAEARVTQIARTGVVLLAALLLSAFLFAPPASAQTKLRAPQVTGDFVADAKANLGQARAAVTGQPADPTAPVACGFKMFIHLTPDNLEQTVKNCVAKANSTLIADVKGAFDSAKAYNNGTGDKDGIACLEPAYAIVQAAAFTPYIPGAPAVYDENGVVKTPEVLPVPAKESGLVTLFQKYREFTLSGGLTACQNWINQPTQLTVAAGAAGVATIAGAALMAPK